jgi:hypothetical protein
MVQEIVDLAMVVEELLLLPIKLLLQLLFLVALV